MNFRGEQQDALAAMVADMDPGVVGVDALGPACAAELQRLLPIARGNTGNASLTAGELLAALAAGEEEADDLRGMGFPCMATYVETGGRSGGGEGDSGAVGRVGRIPTWVYVAGGVSALATVGLIIYFGGRR